MFQSTRGTLVRPLILGCGILIFGGWLTMGAETPVADQRRQAQQALSAGNYKDALTVYQKLALRADAPGDQAAHDLTQAVNCLRHLKHVDQLDSLLAQALAAHPGDWHVLQACGRILSRTEHYGSLVAGKFVRGNQRGGGAFVDVTDRDRAQSLIWLNQARLAWPDDATAAQKADLLTLLAQGLIQNGGEAWRLQALTDLTAVPGFPEPTRPGIGRGRPWGFRPDRIGAPVDESGNPVFFSVPDAFETAQSDGERWRWCLQQIADFVPARREETRMQWANFLHSQFGVQTLAGEIEALNSTDQADKPAGIWSLPTLTDSETIARLATGPRRFSLSDEFNFIQIYQNVLASTDATQANLAASQLTRISLNRQQYPRAVSMLQAALQRFGKDEARTAQLQQITGNWGEFEPATSSVSGTGATLDYRFRNGSTVEFTAHAIKVEQLLQDLRAYLESNPERLEWQKLQIDQIGYRIVQENETKYLGDQVANWSLPVEPRAGHFDRRITVTTPLQKAGAYLVVAKMKEGNESRIIVWLNDTAIIKKPLNNEVLYYVADAVTGTPVPDAHVDFFGWKQIYQPNGGTRHRLETQRFTEKTDQRGMLVLKNTLLSENFQWMAVAKTHTGRLATLGFSGVWYQQVTDETYNQARMYFITDRPVYRPDQKVQFKVWARQVSYRNDDSTRFANQKFTLVLTDPQGTEVWKQEFTSDPSGGFSGEYQLPRQTGLGMYSLRTADNQKIHGDISFRVEEYKKPEFEVLVKSPGKPVRLGEKFTAVIQAKYYSGTPVTQGTVNVKVQRSERESRWYPLDPWDWLYGNGYWWFSPDLSWYPGFSHWGCVRPIPPWWGHSVHPPELVFDQELQLNAEGTAQVEIDTAFALALHPDQDQAYSISVEVTDASRRTITGQGEVLVARQPFQVFAWTDRGYYHAGDAVSASFQARSLDGQGIATTGTLDLLQITYRDGQPVETPVQSWDIATDAQGQATQKLSASEPGQYRLACRLKTGDGANEIEGGYLFHVRGGQFDGRNFRYNQLEVIADQKHYAPGDKARVLINTDRLNSTVLLFVRPVNGIAQSPPQILTLLGKSTEVELEITLADMPNFFVEAVTVADGDVHEEIRELMVPPVQRVLNVEVQPDHDTYLPGQQADVTLKVTDEQGQPVQGNLVLTVYDRAVEYISGGSNIEDIQKFFWQWHRHHHPQSESNLSHVFSQLVKMGETTMQDLGIFGRLSATDNFQATGGSGPGRMRNLGIGMRGGVAADGIVPAPAMAPMAKEMAFDASDAPAPDVAAGLPAIRTNFADTAYWNAGLTTDAQGQARVTFPMPENLSGWKLRAWGLGPRTNVGEATCEVVTAKNIMVRLQAPRFFVERDECVISAVVQNQLETEKTVKVKLQLDGGTLSLLEDANVDSFALIPGAVHSLETEITVAARGEARVDWLVKATQAGTAQVTVQAVTDVESDAMQMAFPVEVHGILKTDAFAGVIRPEETLGRVEFSVPEERQPEQSRLELRFSPTLAGALVDALPYLADYPYGCTEQTLNRFLPTVITQRILLQMGIDLKAVQAKRNNLNSQELGDPAGRAAQWKRFDRNPVFDADEVALMVKTGLRDLTAMQNSDGGWGWFSGYGEHSYPHTTAVVVHGLQRAMQNDLALPEGVLENGQAWLQRYQAEQVSLLQAGERHARQPDLKEPFKTSCSDLDALVFQVLVEGKTADQAMQQFLYRDRLQLSLSSQTLLGLALHTLNAQDQLKMVLKNIEQFVKVDETNQTAFLDLPHSSFWWTWHGNTVEANAFYLKLLARVDAKSERASQLAKYLINNRKHGTYWNSTRDTAYAIEALADYLQASSEAEPQMLVEVWLDGKQLTSVEITPQVLFTFDNTVTVTGTALTAGKHVVEFKRHPLKEFAGPAGPLYFNVYATNFTTEEFITHAGLEVQVQRKFYKLVQDKSATSQNAGSRGQVLNEQVLKYQRVPLQNLDNVTSGDLLEIELEIDSKNDYEYVIFEDFKAAGCEPVDVRSGYTPGGLGAYVEFRDEKVAFFLRQLSRGKHSVSYRVRAEVPGKFSALPTQAQGMYAPELKANSDEMTLRISDRK